MAANDYVDDFKEAKPEKFHGTFRALDTQVMHLAKSRPSIAEDKVSLGQLEPVAKWALGAIDKFLAVLPEEYRKEWREDLATPPSSGRLVTIDTEVKASSHISGSSTASQSSTQRLRES